MKILNIILTIFLFAVFSCAENPSESETSNSESSIPPTSYTLGNPSILKGPFKSNSNGFVQETDSNLDPVGNVYNFVTSGNFGLFRLNSMIATQYVEICATGYYYVENTGTQSQSQITLCSYSDIVANPNPVTNLLTTLQHKRIKYLIDFGGLSIVQAARQSQSETLAIFGIDPITGTFDEMDIGEDTIKGGILLAVSVIMQEGHTAGELQTLIGDIAEDIEADGILDTPTIKATLLSNSQVIDVDGIKSNVEAYYALSGVTITIGEYANYIDSDGDGTLNLDDDDTPDPFSFISVVGAELGTEHESNEVTISGLSENGTTKITGTIFVNDIEVIDPAVENGDIIKLKITSDVRYSTNKQESITMNGVDYTYSVTTKDDDRQQIIVFDSGQPAQDGDFGPTNAQSWCEAEQTSQGLTGSIAPLLSTNSNIKDLFVPDPINPRKVQSLNGGLIATRWNNMFVNENTETFEALGIVDTHYWTGTDIGELTYNCDGWTRNGNIQNVIDFGNYNRHDLANRTNAGDPQCVNTITCDQLKKILCVVY